MAALHPKSTQASVPATAVEACESVVAAVCSLLAVEPEATDSCATLMASLAQSACGAGPLPGSAAAATKADSDDEIEACLANSAAARDSDSTNPIFEIAHRVSTIS